MFLENLGSFFIGFGIIILVFLVMREYVCWYFKINTIKKTLEEINDSLKKIAKNKSDENKL